jgi:hypothetical protein
VSPYHDPANRPTHPGPPSSASSHTSQRAREEQWVNTALANLNCWLSNYGNSGKPTPLNLQKGVRSPLVRRRPPLHLRSTQHQGRAPRNVRRSEQPNRLQAVPKHSKANGKPWVPGLTRSCGWKIHLSRCVEVRKSDIFALRLLLHSLRNQSNPRYRWAAASTARAPRPGAEQDGCGWNDTISGRALFAREQQWGGGGRRAASAGGGGAFAVRGKEQKTNNEVGLVGLCEGAVRSSLKAQPRSCLSPARSGPGPAKSLNRARPLHTVYAFFAPCPARRRVHCPVASPPGGE